MTEIVLPYDRAIVPQETGYWCGPASTQTVLNSRGIITSERDLAREIGTTINGTDFVGLIERVLDRIVPDALYTSFDMPNDPPTQPQRDRFWNNLVRSIDAGWGVILNIVAPPGNYPRGVKGSTSPAYGGGTIYHYVACMGYDDAERALWIADSGFHPFGYWLSFDQACTLIPPKAYCFADAAPARDPGPLDPAAVLSQGMQPSVVNLDRYRALQPAVAQALSECGCTTVDRAAMWHGQIGHESGGLRWMEEIASGEEYEGRGDLGNTQPGDGRRFKGRGPIQVTGRGNYTELSQWAFDRSLAPTPTFFIDDPSQLSTDRYGFLGVVWYWTTQRPLNDASDARDIVRATRYINGGTNGLEDRTNRWNRCQAMGEALLTLTENWTPVLNEILGAR